MILSRQMIFVTGGTILFLLALYLLHPVLAPFIMAVIFAYLMDPLVDRLERKKIASKPMGRTAAVTIIFVLMTLAGSLLLLLVVPLLFKQLASFYHHLPDYIAWLQGRILPYLQSAFGLRLEGFPVYEMKSLIKQNWQQAGGFFAQFLKGATASTLSVVAWLANIIIVPVVSFYLLRDWDRLLEKSRAMLPRAWEDITVGLVRECDEVLGAFVRGQLLVMSALGIIYSIGLGIIGLDLALFLGTLAGFASIVPYLGAILGILLSSVFAYMQFHELLPVFYVLLVFGAGQILESTLLTPLLVGDRIGIHPVGVIFAIMAGGQLAGFVGILVALPVAAVLMVLLRHLLVKYKNSGFYLENK